MGCRDIRPSVFPSLVCSYGMQWTMRLRVDRAGPDGGPLCVEIFLGVVVVALGHNGPSEPWFSRSRPRVHQKKKANDGREKTNKKGLKLTRRGEHISHFGGILVQLEWSLNLNWRAQDSIQRKVQRKPYRESSTHGDIVDVVCPTVKRRIFDDRREIKK